jgi:hypothetical protein
MVVPVGGADKRRQPLPPSLFHYYVQRSGMVSFLLHIAFYTPYQAMGAPLLSSSAVYSQLLILRQ